MKDKNQINGIRFIIHLVAGVYFWGLTCWGSFVYNFGYMFMTLVVGLIFTPLIYKRIKIITNRQCIYNIERGPLNLKEDLFLYDAKNGIIIKRLRRKHET